MGYTYSISSKYNLCYVKISGETSGKEVLSFKKIIFSDPKWVYGMNQINDYLKIKKLILENDDINLIIKLETEQEKKTKDKKRKLAIVSNNDLYDAIFKYYEFRSKELTYKTKIFKTIELALNWMRLESYPYSLIHHR
ncbi:MAG: hypothetical protein WAM24_16845 [Ignavibacteriaceae bacterium]